LGIISILPLVTIVISIFSDDIIQLPIENEFAAYLYEYWFMYVVVLTQITLLGYIVYIYKSNVVPKGKRHLWAAVLFLGHAIAFPIFWFHYIWSRTSE